MAPTLKPITYPWATNTDFPAGSHPWSGMPNKVAPSGGMTADGFEPQELLAAEHANYLLGGNGLWTSFNDLLVDQFGYPIGRPATVFREPFGFWLASALANPQATIAILPGNMQWSYIGTGASFVANDDASSVFQASHGQMLDQASPGYFSILTASRRWYFDATHSAIAAQWVGNFSATTPNDQFYFAGFWNDNTAYDVSGVTVPNAGFAIDGNNTHKWRAWWVDSTGTSHSVDTGVPTDTTPHVFRVEMTGSDFGTTALSFYVDGALITQETTNPPTARAYYFIIGSRGFNTFQDQAMNVGDLVVVGNYSTLS